MQKALLIATHFHAAGFEELQQLSDCTLGRGVELQQVAIPLQALCLTAKSVAHQLGLKARAQWIAWHSHGAHRWGRWLGAQEQPHAL